MCANEQVSKAQSDASTSHSTPSEHAEPEQNEITPSGDSKDTDPVPDSADTADTQAHTDRHEPTETVADTQETEPAQAEADDTETQVAQTGEADDESEVVTTTVVVEDSLTFDENHFSTPTAASPAASAAHSDTDEVSPGRAGRDTHTHCIQHCRRLEPCTYVYPLLSRRSEC